MSEPIMISISIFVRICKSFPLSGRAIIATVRRDHLERTPKNAYKEVK